MQQPSLKIFKLKKLQQVKLILAIAISILLVILYFVVSLNSQNQRAFKSATHSAEVVIKLEEIYSRANELESAQRGYIITNDLSFLIPYARIETELNRYVKELQQLVIDNRKQSENARMLRLHIDEQWRRIHQSSKEARSDKLRGARSSMTDILLTIGKMKSQEQLLMHQRQRASQELADHSTIAIIIAIICITIFIVTATVILLNEYKQKAAIEQELLLSQQLLNNKVNELDSSNKELEQFAYIASHDLQEPLRKIITFNERIMQKFPADIDPAMKDYLNRTIHAAERMKILIDDLLDFSRVTRVEVEKSPVNFKVVIDSIRDNLEVQIKKSHAKLIVNHPFPVIYGDKGQLTRLFQNLVTNAIKFTAPGVVPTIEFSFETAGKKDLEQLPSLSMHSEYHKITVKDNGIGFDEIYKDKIFVIFQRLHGRSEYEGTGIGLSICKKIAEKYQGQITVKSEEGKGSEFYVYFPKKPQ
jgi:signal transduction histidine kinase